MTILKHLTKPWREIVYPSGRNYFSSQPLYHSHRKRSKMKVSRTKVHFYIGILMLISTIILSAEPKQYVEAIEKGNYKAALNILIPLAEEGDINAQYNLGNIYGDIFNYLKVGYLKDKKKAFEWFEKAALQGHTEAQHSLGYMYFTGQGIKQDYQKSFEWELKAANLGHAEAQHGIAVAYEYGLGVPKDRKKAFDWFIKSAHNNYPSAQYSLATYYEYGVGTKQNLEEAIYWYKKTALNGDSESQFILKQKGVKLP